MESLSQSNTALVGPSSQRPEEMDAARFLGWLQQFKHPNAQFEVVIAALRKRYRLSLPRLCMCSICTRVHRPCSLSVRPSQAAGGLSPVREGYDGVSSSHGSIAHVCDEDIYQSFLYPSD